MVQVFMQNSAIRRPIRVLWRSHSCRAMLLQKSRFSAQEGMHTGTHAEFHLQFFTQFSSLNKSGKLNLKKNITADFLQNENRFDCITCFNTENSLLYINTCTPTCLPTVMQRKWTNFCSSKLPSCGEFSGM